MSKLMVTAGLLAALSVPTVASAQRTCEEHSNNRVVGTVAGAGIGAILGSVIAGHGDKGIGALLGAAGGGLVGNQATRSTNTGDCAHAYGYYDRVGAWHASNVRADVATGYYDREGNWVVGVPAGYYDSNNRYVSSTRDGERAGYRDEHGHWVPAAANGYYEADNSYQQGVSSGYYDNGRWVAGRTSGSYDANGRWLAGRAAGRQDANGRWIYDPQPGYWSNGRWIAGQTRGYYDPRGVWIAAGSVGNDRGYTNDDRGYAGNGDRGDNLDVRSRIARIDERIARGESDRTLSRNEAFRARNELTSISRYERSLRNRRGALGPRAEAQVQARLDRLSDTLRSLRQEARGN